MKTNVLISLSLVLSLSGCGMFDAIDSVNEMPGKMDALREDIKGTNGQVEATNVEIKKTNHAVHLQTLLVALTEMRKPENWNYLDPAYAIMPAAKTFAEEAELHELSDFAYFVQQSVGPSIDDYAKSTTECFEYLVMKGKKAEFEAVPEGETAEAKTAREAKLAGILDQHQKENARCAISYNRFTYSLVTALQAVMGRVTQERVEELVDVEIVKGGENRKAAFAALSARYFYLANIQFEKIVQAKIGSEDEATPKLFEKAISSIKGLDYILALGFRKELNNFKYSLETAPGILEEDQISMAKIVFTKTTTTEGYWQDIAGKLSKLEKNFPSSIETTRQNLKAAIQTYNVVDVKAVLP